MPPAPVRVLPLLVDAGTAAGHRLVLLSLEVWDDWADLRFARIDVGAAAPLPRRVPPASAWTVHDDAGTRYEIVDAVGRGGRSFSNGEVRLRPPPPEPATVLYVGVTLSPGADDLAVEVRL